MICAIMKAYIVNTKQILKTMYSNKQDLIWSWLLGWRVKNIPLDSRKAYNWFRPWKAINHSLYSLTTMYWFLKVLHRRRCLSPFKIIYLFPCHWSDLFITSKTREIIRTSICWTIGETSFIKPIFKMLELYDLDILTQCSYLYLSH